MREIRYQHIWPVIYIMCGVIFSVIFLIGFYVLSEITYLFYLIFSAGLVGLGFVIRKRPCIKYNASNFIVTNLFGGTKYHFTFERKQDISVAQNKFYYLGAQINVNQFMLRSEDWQRAIAFFSDDWELTELI